MKKTFALLAVFCMFSATSVFAACPCQKAKTTCNTCEKPKVTCCQNITTEQSYQTQCCNKKSFLKRLWGGTKTAYDNSAGAIYDTIVYPFR